jgi:hypothetical protein
LWVAGTVEGHRQIDRQTETETEEYMRSCEGRTCAAGRSF